MTRSIYLSATLILVGFAIIFLGLNIGLGGIETLGWQNSDPFFTVTNDAVFQVQDSHIRFIGGIWFGVGATFVLGGFKQKALRTTLITLCALIAVAGLFRLSNISGGAVFSVAIIPSLALELLAFPILGWWLLRSGQQVV